MIAQSFVSEEFLARVGYDTHVALEILDLFVGECPSWLGSVEAALDRDDAVAVAAAAHVLKGAAANLAAGAVVERCRQIEDAARSDDLATSRAVCDRLTEEVARLMSALQAWGADQRAAVGMTPGPSVP